MIESLRIRNLAVVEETVVDFVPGLNVLTGETGAGKSLILGALGLLTGARASADAVRAGADKASVEAIVDTTRLPELERELAEQGVEIDDHSLVVSRTVSAEGRSRAQIGGQWVPVAALRELFDGRIEISSQHASQGLRRRDEHAASLDAFGGGLALAASVRARYAALRALRDELRVLRDASAERERQRDFLRFQCEEIDDAAIAEGEFGALDDEQRRLAHAEEIARGRQGAAAALAPEDGSGGALAQVELALRECEAIAAVDPSVAPLVDRLRGIREELADAALDLARGADRVEVDPARLEAVETRIEQIEALRRKYGATEVEIAAHREGLAETLASLGQDAGRVDELETECAAAAEALAADAVALSASRRAAAETLAAEVERALSALDMAGARFEAALQPAKPSEGTPCGPGGAEEVEFLLSANPGEPPRPLVRVASGGELSRVFLALTAARLRGGSDEGRMLVFDEVDTGIGGRAIDQVAALLQEIGARHQVFCITHWPQIAAAALGHHRVRKTRVGGRTRTAVEALGAEGRVEELARMAGGTKVTTATRQHARELLKKRNKTTRRSRGSRASAPSRPS